MATAQQHHLIGTHIDVVQPSTSAAVAQAGKRIIDVVLSKVQLVAAISFGTFS